MKLHDLDPLVVLPLKVVLREVAGEQISKEGLSGARRAFEDDLLLVKEEGFDLFKVVRIEEMPSESLTAKRVTESTIVCLHSG